MVCLGEQEPSLGQWAFIICCFDVEDMGVGGCQFKRVGEGRRRGWGMERDRKTDKGKKGKSTKEKEGMGARGREEWTTLIG